MLKFVRFIVLVLVGVSRSVWAGAPAPEAVCFYPTIQGQSSQVRADSRIVYNCSIKAGVKPSPLVKKLCTGTNTKIDIGQVLSTSISDPQTVPPAYQGADIHSLQLYLGACQETFASFDSVKSFYQQYHGKSFYCDSTDPAQFKIIPGAPICTDPGSQWMFKKTVL